METNAAALCSKRLERVLEQIEYFPTAKLSAQAEWLNGPVSFAGKLSVVCFFRFTSIACLHALTELKATLP